MELIPIANTATQTFTVTLAGQACSINLYQRSSGFFCDVYLNATLIIGGVKCENLNRIVRDNYLGFVGDLFFYDTQGNDSPTFPGLGTRFLLLYTLDAPVDIMQLIDVLGITFPRPMTIVPLQLFGMPLSLEIATDPVAITQTRTMAGDALTLTPEVAQVLIMTGDSLDMTATLGEGVITQTRTMTGEGLDLTDGIDEGVIIQTRTMTGEGLEL